MVADINDTESSGYMAFISYRHADNKDEDRQWATWLHHQLEVYDIPAELIGTKNTRDEIIPERIYLVFRDEISLPADADLSSAITAALDDSGFLVVLCSPRAVQSKHLSNEIVHFKASGKAARVIAALLLGEPNASVDPSKIEDPEDARTLECFPAPLQYDVNSNGELQLDKPTEPIAADFRLPDGNKGLTSASVYKKQLMRSGHSAAKADRLANQYEEKLSTAKLKIIAGILGVRLDTLMARDKVHQLKKERARTRRAWQLGAVIASLFLAAAVSATFSWFQFKEAEAERNIAQRSLAKFFANEATRLDPQEQGSLGVLLGIEAYRLDPTTQTDAALRSALSRQRWEPLAGHEGRVKEVALSNDGRWLASAGADNTLRLWDLDHRNRTGVVIHADSNLLGHIAVGGGRLAATIEDRILLWDLSDAESPPVELYSALGQISALTMDDQGMFVAATDETGVVRLWNLSGDRLPSVDLQTGSDVFNTLAFSPNGMWLTAAGPHSRVALWRTEALAGQPQYLSSPQLEVYDVAFSDDSQSLATGGFDPLGFNLMSIWSMTDPEAAPLVISKPPSQFGFAFSIASLAFGSIDNNLVSGATDGVIRVTFPDDRDSDIEFAGLAKMIGDVALAPAKWVAAATDSGIIWLYNLRGGGMEPIVLSDEEGFVFAVMPNKSASQLFSGNSDGRISLHNSSRPAESAKVLSTMQSPVRAMSLSQDNRWLVVGDEAGRIRLQDLNNPDESPVEFAMGTGTIIQLGFDSGFRRLVAATASSLHVYDLENLDGEPSVLEVDGDDLIAFEFGADDKLLAVTSSNRVLTWASSLLSESVSRIELGGEMSSAAAISTDGLWLAMSKDNNRLEVLKIDRLQADPTVLSIPFAGDTFSVFGYPVVFSPDSKWLAFAGGDGNIWIWRVGDWSLEPFALQGPGIPNVSSLQFSDDGRWLASGGMDSVSRLWSLPDALIDRACHRSGRNLTLAEWRRYWGDRDYVRTCADWPLPEDLIQESAADYLRNGNENAVIARLRNASGIASRQSPAINEIHRSALANSLVGAALELANTRFPNRPDYQQLFHHFNAAFELFPNLNLAALDYSPRSWNQLCWFGSLDGHARDVLFACELAVARAMPDQAGFYQDSRGVARALSGDFSGAINDMEAFITWAETEATYQDEIGARQRWVDKLRVDQNPFDEIILQRLRRGDL